MPVERKSGSGHAFFVLILLTATLFTAAAAAQEAPPPQTSSPAVFDANFLVPLAKKAVPSVVNISTLSTTRGRYSQALPEDLFRQFFEELFGGRYAPAPAPTISPRPIPRAVSLGSGFIIDAKGIILTNNHVVGEAEEIKVKFTESAEEIPVNGEVIGRDPELDVALLRVKTDRELTPLPLGDSDALEVGEFVIAVGNPFAQGHSVTHGIISAKGRAAPQFPLGSYLQTDAPINPGNSGGPLISLKGEVIGINNAIEARAQGIGFAIPISLVKAILPQLRTQGVVSRGYIGLMTEPLTPEAADKIGVSRDLRAPFVTHVYAGDPADQAGIKPYDVILEADGKPVQTPSDLVTLITTAPLGKVMLFKISRGGRIMDVEVRIGKRPSPQEGIRARRERKERSRGR